MSKNKDLLYSIEDQLEFLKLGRMAEELDEIFRSKDFLEIELSLIIRDGALKHRSIQQTNLIENVEYFRNKLATALSIFNR